MARISDIKGRITLKDDFTRKLKGAQAQLQKTSKTMQRTGRQMQTAGIQMSAAITLPLAAVGGLSVKAFASFDQAMTKSTAIMGDVSDALKNDMVESAKQMARETTFSAKQAADSYFFLASAGLDAQQSIAALPKVAAFAEAGAFDMARATDLLTDAQSALGLTIRDDVVKNMENMVRVSDVLVKANTLANATVEQFSTALTSEAGAALKAFDKDVEEGVAVLAAFADQGVKAEEAGTGLSRIMRLLSKGALENADEFKKYGVAVFDSEGAMRNFADILGDLESALEGVSAEQRAFILDQLGFQARVQGVLLPLLGTSEAIRRYEADLRKAGGTTKDVAEKQLQSFANQMTLVKNQLVVVGIELGSKLAPIVLEFTKDVIVPIIDRLADWVESFGNLSSTMQKTAIGLGVLLAAAGPLLIVVGQLTIAIGALNLAALVNPWTALAVAIAGVTVAVKAYNNQLDRAIAKTVQLANDFGAAAKIARDAISGGGLSGKGLQEFEAGLASAREEVERLKTALEEEPKFLGGQGGRKNPAFAQLERDLATAEQQFRTLQKQANNPAFVEAATKVRQLKEELGGDSGGGGVAGAAEVASDQLERMSEVLEEIEGKHEALRRADRALADSLGVSVDSLEEININYEHLIDQLPKAKDILVEINEEEGDFSDGLQEWLGTLSQISDALSGMDDTLGDVVQAFAGLLSGTERLNKLDDQNLKLTEFNTKQMGELFGAALQVGQAMFALGQTLGIFKGDLGVSSFGGSLGGDYSQEGSAVGAVIGAAIAAYFTGGAGAAQGAQIGAAAGGLLGSFILKGLDEGLATVSFDEATREFSATLDKVEGGLRNSIEGLAEGIESALDSITGSLGVVVEGIPDIALKIRGEEVSVFVGNIKAVFDNLEDATEFAVLKSLELARLSGGVDEAITQVLAGGSGSIEQLQDNLEFVGGLINDFQLSVQGLSQIEIDLASLPDVLNATSIRLQEMGLAADQVERLVGGQLVASLQAMRQSITGEQLSPAEQLKVKQQQAELFNATLELMRAELEAKKAMLEARLELFRSELTVDKTLITGKSEVLQAEAEVGKAFLVARVQAVKGMGDIYQGELDLLGGFGNAAVGIIGQTADALEKQIAAIGKILGSLPDLIDIGSIKISGIGAANSLSNAAGKLSQSADDLGGAAEGLTDKQIRDRRDRASARALVDRLLPEQAALREAQENFEQLERALRRGWITAQQYTDAIAVLEQEMAELQFPEMFDEIRGLIDSITDSISEQERLVAELADSLQGLEGFLTNLRLSGPTNLTPAQQVAQLQSQLQAAAAAAAGGDVGAIAEFQRIAQALQSIGAEAFGTAGAGFEGILDLIESLGEDVLTEGNELLETEMEVLADMRSELAELLEQNADLLGLTQDQIDEIRAGNDQNEQSLTELREQSEKDFNKLKNQIQSLIEALAA